MAYNNTNTDNSRIHETSYRTDHIGQGLNTATQPQSGYGSADPGAGQFHPTSGSRVSGPGAQVLTGHPNTYGNAQHDNLGYNDGPNYNGVSGANNHHSTIPGVPPGPSRGPLPSTQNMGTGARMTGKVEYALGAAVGSDNLKMKGLEKQRQAELAQTQQRSGQRLDAAGREHHERALPHGPQPDNTHFVGGGGVGPL